MGMGVRMTGLFSCNVRIIKELCARMRWDYVRTLETTN